MALSSLERPPVSIAPKVKSRWELLSRRRVTRFVRQHRLSLGVLIGLGIIGCLPYNLKPGGKVEMLPLTQQQIQAKVSGRVNQVLVDGGNRTVIPAGKLLATLDAPELETQKQTIAKQIETQHATIRVARRAIAVSEQQLSVASVKLQTGRVRERFSARAAKRYYDLSIEGAVSQQVAEDFKRQADVEASDVQELESTVSERLQSLKESEERIAVAQGELERLNKQLIFAADELERSRFLMPFDGIIIDHHLKDKVGTYLHKGDTFATAEAANTNELRARVQLPEVVADRLKPGRKVDVKLMAFPEALIRGEVVSIEPSLHLIETEQSRSDDSGDTVTVARRMEGRLLGVIIQLPNKDGRLRPGMTGYAKVDGETVPLAFAFSRSLVRFFQIEVWSWLP